MVEEVEYRFNIQHTHILYVSPDKASGQFRIRCLTFLSARRTWKIKSNVIYLVHFIQRGNTHDSQKIMSYMAEHIFCMPSMM